MWKNEIQAPFFKRQKTFIISPIFERVLKYLSENFNNNNNNNQSARKMRVSLEVSIKYIKQKVKEHHR